MEVLRALPARRGHFLLESGYHSDLWLTLDELFSDPTAVAPLVASLSARLAPHDPTAVCGPLLGGAFLAQALATTLGVRFYFTEPVVAAAEEALFTTEYRLPAASRRSIGGRSVAVVDDAISAGSSVRATVAELASAGASTIVVGTFLVLGDVGLRHFAEQAIPVEALQRAAFELWKPSDCPLCRSGAPLEDPRQTGGAMSLSPLRSAE